MIRVLHRRGIFIFYFLVCILPSGKIDVRCKLTSRSACKPHCRFHSAITEIDMRAWLCSHVSMVQRKCNACLQNGGFSESSLGESWMMGLVRKTTRAAFTAILPLILKLACGSLPGMPPRAVCARNFWCSKKLAWYPVPRPAFRRLQYRTASDEKLGVGLGTRLPKSSPNMLVATALLSTSV